MIAALQRCYTFATMVANYKETDNMTNSTETTAPILASDHVLGGVLTALQNYGEANSTLGSRGAALVDSVKNQFIAHPTEPTKVLGDVVATLTKYNADWSAAHKLEDGASDAEKETHRKARNAQVSKPLQYLNDHLMAPKPLAAAVGEELAGKIGHYRINSKQAKGKPALYSANIQEAKAEAAPPTGVELREAALQAVLVALETFASTHKGAAKAREVNMTKIMGALDNIKG